MQLLKSEQVEQEQKLSLYGAFWRIGAEQYVPLFAKHSVLTFEDFMRLDDEQFESIVKSNCRCRFDLETRSRLQKYLKNQCNDLSSLCNRATFRDLFHAQFAALHFRAPAFTSNSPNALSHAHLQIPYRSP
jgi:hypothetical protein